jgi:hypothetical protein
MKQIDDLFLNAHYSDLSPSEQSFLEDLCSDEDSFQQVKSLLSQSAGALPVNPPEHMLDLLNQTFDQTYSEQEVQKMRPRIFNLFIASAVAATVLIFLTVYFFGTNNEPQEQFAKVEKKEQKEKNKQSNLTATSKQTQTPQIAAIEQIPAPPVALDVETQNDVLMDEPAVIASIDMEDAKSERFRGSRSDDTAAPGDENIASNVPKSNTYMWTSNEKNLSSEQVVIAEVSMKKQKNSDSKRLNTSLMLKQIKPVY